MNDIVGIWSVTDQQWLTTVMLLAALDLGSASQAEVDEQAGWLRFNDCWEWRMARAEQLRRSELES